MRGTSLFYKNFFLVFDKIAVCCDIYGMTNRNILTLNKNVSKKNEKISECHILSPEIDYICSVMIKKSV